MNLRDSLVGALLFATATALAFFVSFTLFLRYDAFLAKLSMPSMPMAWALFGGFIGAALYLIVVDAPRRGKAPQQFLIATTLLVSLSAAAFVGEPVSGERSHQLASTPPQEQVSVTEPVPQPLAMNFNGPAPSARESGLADVPRPPSSGVRAIAPRNTVATSDIRRALEESLAWLRVLERNLISQSAFQVMATNRQRTGVASAGQAERMSERMNEIKRNFDTLYAEQSARVSSAPASANELRPLLSTLTSGDADQARRCELLIQNWSALDTRAGFDLFVLRFTEQFILR